ncbi:hypothetical protein HOY80DRAFT_1020533 [Tuber brumale]|nr:hypothetical protein HOY80DRAFT_1020533 [Tuber brumale]
MTFNLTSKPTPGQKPPHLASLVSAELTSAAETLTISQFQFQRGLPVNGGASRNTSVHRLVFPPYFDTKYLLKSHHDTATRDPGARASTEVGGMVHARRAFERHMSGCHLIPENYYSDSTIGALAMEFVDGEPLTWQVIGGWSAEQDKRFIRRMAAIRLVLLAQTMGQIGAPTVGEEGELGVGPMSGEIYFGEERSRYYPFYSRGPFRYALQFARAGLENEIQFFHRRHNEGLFTHPPRRPYAEFDLGFPPDWPTWITYLRSLLDHFTDSRGHNEAENPHYHLTHGDLSAGNNIMTIGGKITSIIDWETASYAPFSESISDIPFTEGTRCCFNPDDWTRQVNTTGDNQYFLTMLSAHNESLDDRLATYAAGPRPTYPLWSEIERFGGVLLAQDFEDYPGEEFEFGDPLDGVDAYGHSDGGLDEPQHEPLRLGDKDLEFYIVPVWALMQEYITRADRSEGMLEFPEETGAPLAAWRDKVLEVLTSQQMTTDMQDRLVPRGMEGL